MCRHAEISVDASTLTAKPQHEFRRVDELRLKTLEVDFVNLNVSTSKIVLRGRYWHELSPGNPLSNGDTLTVPPIAGSNGNES